ncbi:YdeI family protein [Flagellimonas sp. S3867]|uniref:YdeI/OmpD-associated family protein n=1 Tax=Flagellimonas sp. S3867 TaxID=2768063 RepID=UPI0016886FB7|nr:YdeI/OmpD-associated family protein [Flagellimonas sp. S3867]
MEKVEKTEAYYQTEHRFKEEIIVLRKLALQTDCVEDYKWNIPVYTINGKNVFGICRFKNHFGVWFFNGSFLSDSKKVLRNAQEGKTKSMRQWKFESMEAIDSKQVLNYMNEAIENQKKGLSIAPEKSSKELQVPALLRQALTKDATIKTAFETLSPYKQKEFCEYIMEAKQEKTKARRLEKILPMIAKGIGLNDAYR